MDYPDYLGIASKCRGLIQKGYDIDGRDWKDVNIRDEVWARKLLEEASKAFATGSFDAKKEALYKTINICTMMISAMDMELQRNKEKSSRSL